MYEQEEISPVRRILWLIVTFAIIFSVLWGIVWLLFLRHSSPVAKPQKSNHSKQSQTSQSSSDSNGGTSSGSSNGESSSTSDVTQPTQLANTGAGDVVSLFVGVTIISGVAYQVHLRKKLAV